MTAHSWSEHVVIQNRWLNYGLFYLFKAAAIMLAHPSNGGEKGDPTIYQGSWNTSVGASAGTHAGADAIDISPYNWRNRLRVFRILGLCLWLREAIRGVWDRHMHGITNGGAAAKLGQQQTASFMRHHNGLAGDGKDLTYPMLVFPRFVFPEKPEGRPGVRHFDKLQQPYEQPTIVAPKRGVAFKKGEAFNVVAVVRVDTSYWGINEAAQCVPMTSLVAA